MQRGFNSVFLRGPSRFAESEFDDVTTSLIHEFNLLIYFFRTGVEFQETQEYLHRTVGGASHQHGWISIGRTMKVDHDRDIRTAQTYMISIGWQAEVQQEP